jgi:hypothetical protein
MKSQGQDGGSGPDTAALHDSVYSLNGRIPGDTFAEQGANAARWGLALPQIALNAGREELDARMAQARSDNDQYAQQLIQVAATYPGLKAQALQQLTQYELDQANFRLNAQHTARADALAARSERAQEKAAGISAEIRKGQQDLEWAKLRFQSRKELARAQAAAAKGKTIDVSASKLLGHVVYKDGTEDKSIKVQQSGSGAAASKARAHATAVRSAFAAATKLLGQPVKAAPNSQGAYVARTSGVPSRAVFPPAFPGGPGTTNNPKYARRNSTASGWQDAYEKVWGGDRR